MLATQGQVNKYQLAMTKMLWQVIKWDFQVHKLNTTQSDSPHRGIKRQKMCKDLQSVQLRVQGLAFLK